MKILICNHYINSILATCEWLLTIGETIKLAVEFYVGHLSGYNFHLFYKPEILFDETFQYDNRIYVEFNHLYHWHQFMPETFNVAGDHYSIKDFMFNTKPVLKHGTGAFVDAMSKSLGGRVRLIYIIIRFNCGCYIIVIWSLYITVITHHKNNNNNKQAKL